jgi:hypothetical protein
VPAAFRVRADVGRLEGRKHALSRYRTTAAVAVCHEDTESILPEARPHWRRIAVACQLIPLQVLVHRKAIGEKSARLIQSF